MPLELSGDRGVTYSTWTTAARPSSPSIGLADVQLVNKAVFDRYRSELRNIVLNPPITVTWPTEPEAVWS